MEKAGIYLHIPFCRTRCSYCDFATAIYRSDEAVERYVAALIREINSSWCPAPQIPDPRSKIQNPVDTIYFGGGTPSLLSAARVEKILRAVGENFELAAEPEITLEMNPATVSPETLRDYRSLGVNRASFGVQTFDDRSLRLLARDHNAGDASKTYEMLRRAGFDNISFDLIAGLPGQTLIDWEKNLRRALELGPEHLSLYLLEIHEGTPLAEQIRSGRRPRPDEELAGQMYQLTADLLTAGGFEQYEISNFARPGFRSRHNLKYWQFAPYFSYGVSAHSFDGGHFRWSNERDPARYVELIEAGRSPVAEVTELGERDRRSEYAFLRLRLAEGIDLADYQNLFGRDLRREYQDELAELRAAGLITNGTERLSLTRRGRLFSNEVFRVFV